jgi:hypothetical protein
MRNMTCSFSSRVFWFLQAQQQPAANRDMLAHMPQHRPPCAVGSCLACTALRSTQLLQLLLPRLQKLVQGMESGHCCRDKIKRLHGNVLPHLGRIITTGRPSLSGCGETKVLPVSASFSTCAHTISCGRVSRRLQGQTAAAARGAGSRVANCQCV